MQDAIRDLVLSSPDFSVCAVAASAEEALALPAIDAADLVVSDLSLPGQSGLDLIRTLKAARPERLCLVFSSHSQQSYVESALDAGASGYVVKSDGGELLAALRRTLAGETYLSQSVTRQRRPPKAP